MHWSNRLAILYLVLCFGFMLPVPLRKGTAAARWHSVQGLTLPGSLLISSFPVLGRQGDALLALMYATLAGANALALSAGLSGLSRLIAWLERLDDPDQSGSEPPT